MIKKLTFTEKEPFLHKLEELIKSGVPRKKIRAHAPYPVHEMDHMLEEKPSALRYFTLLGALSGLMFGLWFTSWTSLDWPIITGGKPIVSWPAYVIVSFELTVLFGGVISFIGFLLLSTLPSIKRIINPEEPGNYFVIEYESEA
ncbi:MAG: DUF3341 domain-containing protein [Calditrichia bacterium]